MNGIDGIASVQVQQITSQQPAAASPQLSVIFT
jgi:hypothetical protein